MFHAACNIEKLIDGLGMRLLLEMLLLMRSSSSMAMINDIITVDIICAYVILDQKSNEEYR